MFKCAAAMRRSAFSALHTAMLRPQRCMFSGAVSSSGAPASTAAQTVAQTVAQPAQAQAPAAPATATMSIPAATAAPAPSAAPAAISAAPVATIKRDKVKITFIGKVDERIEVEAFVGDTLLDVAQLNALDVEGACGGSMACGTCHMLFEKADFDKLPKALEDEEDTLELAVGLTPTSRLGCQVLVDKALDGAVIRLPKVVKNQML